MQIIASESREGDICHKDICNVSKEDAERFADEFCKPYNLFICTSGDPFNITPDQFYNLKEWIKDKGYDKVS